MKITDPKRRASLLLVRGGFTVSESAKLLSLSVEDVYLYVTSIPQGDHAIKQTTIVLTQLFLCALRGVLMHLKKPTVVSLQWSSIAWRYPED